LLSVILAIPALAIVTYDFIYYEPTRGEISRVIASATAEERHLPMPLEGFLRWEFRKGTEVYAARLLMVYLDIAQQRATQLHWAVIYELWIAERLRSIATPPPAGGNPVELMGVMSRTT
jgi:hypothetical protein